MNSGYGKVYLVGSGPGDPELLTIKARKLIDKAEVIVYDQLPGEAILQSMPEAAEKIDAGKYAGNHKLTQTEINDLIVKKAEEGTSVVRLKGGDPYMFGRGGEEAEKLVQAGIDFEVVPGITSAIAVPAYAGIPVTHRDHASMVTFITGHEDPTKKETGLDWENLARFPGTLVIFMGVKRLEQNMNALKKYGKPPTTPVAIIEKGTRPDQRITTGNIENIAEKAKEADVKAPAITVVGDVVSVHDILGMQKVLWG
ncbi:uroporphyrinogen-III C-methyltransferase [Methanohalophilus portucalensis]|uniref:uroporphyrinogen-III C-methyltransferase n=2 Tax=Methanohalophilus portucalensis TaxID=39664 RepID=A0A1L9C6C1_9EURY|nr:uroporphyrinogen-III C-methyltransferase [Methanohalophilus portucalensis]ATU08680.1 uroporphyrinogen-III C-methyltransferase [Methanohalophilus portucalensis]OJH50065.1 uroporphyrinogen-III C-methyltransferase [Methanohalophilus portucalensis FDF-1]RNI13146.1 uroporphyrinogen-III C-methyltransferase [Methanohalophilus portucalensis FDF-1]SMH31672.1 uroporphyrinogen-III C-methyltransferase [Methanohalophilus portucalensis FDF-1]